MTQAWTCCTHWARIAEMIKAPTSVCLQGPWELSGLCELLKHEVQSSGRPSEGDRVPEEYVTFRTRLNDSSKKTHWTFGRALLHQTASRKNQKGVLWNRRTRPGLSIYNSGQRLSKTKIFIACPRFRLITNWNLVFKMRCLWKAEVEALNFSLLYICWLQWDGGVIFVIRTGTRKR